MKRRTFTFGLGALFATPALPKLTLAAAPSAAQDHYWVAKLIAETRGAVSPAQLGAQLRIPAGLAGEVQSLLIDRGVVAAPVNGVAQALSPIRIPQISSAAGAHIAPKPAARVDLDKLAKRVLKDEETACDEPVSTKEEATPQT